MKLLSIGFLFLITSTSLAVQHKYRIQSQILIDGKVVSTPNIITMENEKANIQQVIENPDQEIKLEVIASELNNDKIKNRILMNFDVHYVSGNKNIKSNPQVIAKSGSEAIVTIGGKENSPELQMKILAIRE